MSKTLPKNLKRVPSNAVKEIVHDSVVLKHVRPEDVVFQINDERKKDTKFDALLNLEVTIRKGRRLGVIT